MTLTADRAARRVTEGRESPDAAAPLPGGATVVGGPAHDRQARTVGLAERGGRSGFAQTPEMGELEGDESGRPANRLGSLDATQRAPVCRWRAADSTQRWFVRSERQPR